MTRTKGVPNIPWFSIVKRLRMHPDRWLVVPELSDVPERTLEVIRRRQRPALRMEDGIIRARVRAHITLEGRTTLTLILKFSPKEVPDGT